MRASTAQKHLQSFDFSTSQVAMDVETIFHMKGGVGETSYARNSSLQKKASDVAKHIALETVRDVYFSQNPTSFGIADLGCSSGPNTLSIIKDIIDVVWRTNSNFCQPTPEFRVYLNDLPTNDFNSIFKTLPDFCRELQREKNNGRLPIFIGGYPGSFYGRLFPNNCLHFVYSSYSLHWLSRIPVGLYNQELGECMNKGSVYISESSPPWVSQAYLKQFQEDFSLFLRSRAEELIVGGRMVLILLGRRESAHIDRGNSVFWRVLTRSFETLVSKGEIEREKLDSYDVHFYAPSREEMEDEVRKEGSFGLDLLEKCEIERAAVKGGESYGTAVAMAVRAIQESMISHHFGEEILDSLFETYAKILDEEMGKEEIKAISLVLVLRKL